MRGDVFLGAGPERHRGGRCRCLRRIPLGIPVCQGIHAFGLEPAGFQGFLSRTGKTDLGIGAEAHDPGLPSHLVAKAPRFPAVRADVQIQPGAVVVHAGPGLLDECRAEPLHGFGLGTNRIEHGIRTLHLGILYKRSIIQFRGGWFRIVDHPRNGG
jgi:hypothetical protein